MNGKTLDEFIELRKKNKKVVDKTSDLGNIARIIELGKQIKDSRGMHQSKSVNDIPTTFNDLRPRRNASIPIVKSVNDMPTTFNAEPVSP